MTCKDRLRYLGLFSMKERRLWTGLTAVCKHLMGTDIEDRGRQSSEMRSKKG